jgi:hypothetical protein
VNATAKPVSAPVNPVCDSVNVCEQVVTAPLHCPICPPSLAPRRYKYEHSVLQHIAAAHTHPTHHAVCPIEADVDASPVAYGPPTLAAVLKDAHGVAHRHALSMQHWLQKHHMDWRGCLRACQNFFDACEPCMRVNPTHHSMQPTTISTGEAVNTHFSFDLMYFKVAGKNHAMCVLTDNLSTELYCRVLDVPAAANVPEALGATPTGSRKVLAAMIAMSPPATQPRVLYVDNECRLSDHLKRALQTELLFTIRPFVPNVHGNGVAERGNRRLRACLNKRGVSSAGELPGAVRECIDSLNESPTRRLRWHAPMDVPLMSPEAQRQLGEHICAGKVRDRQRRRHRRRRTRLTLPTVPTPYLVRDHKLTHALYEGPFMGYVCDLHGVNCRSIWRDGFHCTSPVHLKQYRGQVAAPLPPPPAPDGEPCGVHRHRCGRSGMKIGACSWCKFCHLASGQHCAAYPNHRNVLSDDVCDVGMDQPIAHPEMESSQQGLTYHSQDRSTLSYASRLSLMATALPSPHD